MNMADKSELCLQVQTHEQWLENIDQGGCFLLAESAHNEDVRSLAERLNGVPLEHSRLYWDETGRIHASISPYLIMVTRDNWPLLQDKICAKPNWGLAVQLEWFMHAFTPPQQLTELMSHLREWTWLETADKASRLLRLADWLVLSQLMSASTQNERSAIFGPIAQFVSLEGDKVTSMTRALETKSTLPHRFPQQLSAPQWMALQMMENNEQHQAYQAHLKEHHQQTATWSDEHLQQFIIKQTSNAETLGFMSRQDTVKYLSLAVIFGDGFSTQAWAEKILSTQPQGAQSQMSQLYQAALQQLDKDVTV